MKILQIGNQQTACVLRFKKPTASLYARPSEHHPTSPLARAHAAVHAGPAPSTGASPPATARDWLLPCVALGQADDQALFELCLRLKYTGDARIPLAALVELHGGMLLDLPVEAVVKKHDVVVSVSCAVRVGQRKQRVFCT